MSSVISGVVQEQGDGFIVLRAGIRICLTSQVLPSNVAPGTRVIITARLRGAEWIAAAIEVEGNRRSGIRPAGAPSRCYARARGCALGGVLQLRMEGGGEDRRGGRGPGVRAHRVGPEARRACAHDLGLHGRSSEAAAAPPTPVRSSADLNSR